jgi:hypothetical protein
MTVTAVPHTDDATLEQVLADLAASSPALADIGWTARTGPAGARERRRQRLGRPMPTTYRTSRAAPGTLSQIHHG